MRLELVNAGQGRVEVVDFEPEEDAVSMGEVGIADGAMMMFHIPAMELHDEFAVGNELLVMRAAMAALAVQEPLVPTAAGFDVTNTNERLRAHRR